MKRSDRTSITSIALSLRATRIAKHSWVNSSSTLSIRYLRPSSEGSAAAQLLSALILYVFDGTLNHALCWILFAPSFHPDVDCGVVGPDAVTRSRARHPPVRRSEKACEPVGIACGLIDKFSFRMLYRSGLARRAIMKC